MCKSEGSTRHAVLTVKKRSSMKWKGPSLRSVWSPFIYNCSPQNTVVYMIHIFLLRPRSAEGAGGFFLAATTSGFLRLFTLLFSPPFKGAFTTCLVLACVACLFLRMDGIFLGICRTFPCTSSLLVEEEGDESGRSMFFALLFLLDRSEIICWYKTALVGSVFWRARSWVTPCWPSILYVLR